MKQAIVTNDEFRIQPESASKSRFNTAGTALAPGNPARPLLAYGANGIAFAYIVKTDRIIVGVAYADELNAAFGTIENRTEDLALTPHPSDDGEVDLTGYLRASASTFDFWDNDLDAEYDDDV